MFKGIVKWFNPTKGYGFIAPETGGKDVFVHISALEAAGITHLSEGDEIFYEVETRQGKVSAVKLQRVAESA